jgi:hypothetical protein
VTDASKRGHETADCPACPGPTATAENAVVRHRLRKAHADPGSHRGRHANEEGILAHVRGKGGRKDGRKRLDRAIHQSRESGLDNLENEAATLELVFFVGEGLTSSFS